VSTTTLTDLWPLFGLEIQTERLRLVVPSDEQLVDLTRLFDQIHDRSFLPFRTDWVGLPSPQRELQFLQYHWRTRAEWSLDSWHLMFAIEYEGELVGTHTLAGTRFPTLRSLTAGFWVAKPWRRCGIVSEARRALLQFSFETLQAENSLYAVRSDNEASLAVAAKFGYEANGTSPALYGEQIAEELSLRLTKNRWSKLKTGQEQSATIHGFEACLPFFDSIDAE